MQEIKAQSVYYAMAAVRQAVTARREERLFEHTHRHKLTHAGTQNVRYVLQHRDVVCCNLIVYKIHLDGWLQKRGGKEKVAGTTVW